jgi:beta-glucosidase
MPLPTEFLIGCATSSHQIEGGQRNDWTRWEDAGKTRDRSGAACDSWNRWREDLRCLKELGANAYRFSVEWSRLEPEEGAWDVAAAARYREMLQEMRAAGLRTMMTLFHFTLPLWVADRGGVEWAGGEEAFARFASRVAREVGEPDLWCTINEPNVYAYHGYLKAIFPPGVTSFARTVKVMRGLNRWHARAAAALREAGSKAPVGIAHHMRAMDPLRRWNPMDYLAMGVSDRLFNGIPEGTFAQSDYIGLNYYSRDFIATGRVLTAKDGEKNDLGWEVYPEGLYRCLKRLARFGKPIYVTENGICDAAGEKRARFIREHVLQLERARYEHVDVRGYFHWSLLDNFEWAEGYAPRFGLYSIDRRPAPGVDAFREAARRFAGSGA